MKDRGVEADAYFQPIHLQPFVRRRLHYGPGDFPVCETVADRTLALPFFTGMTRRQVRRVAETLRSALVSVRGRT